MDDYINREAAKQALGEAHFENYGNAIMVIMESPAADVKPIVRCEECRHGYDDVGGKRCTYGVCVDCIVESDFYCAYGERDKDNG